MFGKPRFASVQTANMQPGRYLLDKVTPKAGNSPCFTELYAKKLSEDKIHRATSQPTPISSTYPSPSSLVNEESITEIANFSPSKTRLTFKEHGSALMRAQEYCFQATQLASINKSKIGDHLDELFGKFVKEIEKVSLTVRPYSLLNEPTATYSEIDFFNAIRHIDSPTQRAKLWKRMTNIYNVHVSGPTSEIEQKQLATLFFNSIFVDNHLESERIDAIGRYVTANRDKENSFRYVLANLGGIDSGEEQAYAARILIGYISFLPFDEERNAIYSFRDFLPDKINKNDTAFLHDMLDTLFIDLAVREVEYIYQFREYLARQSTSL